MNRKPSLRKADNEISLIKRVDESGNVVVVPAQASIIKGILGKRDVLIKVELTSLIETYAMKQ